MKRKDCVAMLLVGGQGSRLKCLTSNIAKPGLVFAGKYRIVDFCLSNCVNSGIETVGMLTQYKPFLLNSYVGVGAAWDLDIDRGGSTYCLPSWDPRGGPGTRERPTPFIKTLISSTSTIQSTC